MTGALFVEHLATHVKRDAIVRLADAVEATGNGERFTDAFRSAFGLSLTEAVRAFAVSRNPSRSITTGAR